MPQSIPELALANARTREALTDAVDGIRHKTNVRERWRLLVARTRQQLHRDPTPLVALSIVAGAGAALIAVGARIGPTAAGRLEAAETPMLLPLFLPPKPGKDGELKGHATFKRRLNKLNPVGHDRRRG